MVVGGVILYLCPLFFRTQLYCFPIMDDPKIHFTIGDVAKMFGVNTSLIRYWEKEFDFIEPHKNDSGRRYYTAKDIENFRVIYRLVKEEGLTLDGARKRLQNNSLQSFSRVEILDRLHNIRRILLDIKETL